MKMPVIARAQTRNYLNIIRNWLGRQRYALSLKVIALCVTATVGALALTFALYQWQDWSADRAELVREQLSLSLIHI